MKQFPDLRQLADCPIPEGSQVGAKSGQTGQVRAAPSLAVQGDKEKEGETGPDPTVASWPPHLSHIPTTAAPVHQLHPNQQVGEAQNGPNTP